jgi:hypothetical protein
MGVVLNGDGEVVVGAGAGGGDTTGDLGDAGVSWCRDDSGNEGTLGKFPDEGVFAAAAANDENYQRICS